jgi:hypothetical protein
VVRSLPVPGAPDEAARKVLIHIDFSAFSLSA